LCDRHYGGINYPVGGVGGIAVSLANGLVEKGSEIRYKANVTNVILENGKAVSSSYRLLKFKYLELRFGFSAEYFITTGWSQVIKWEGILC
jgi:phytoene dehydrogenase-like protein